MTASPAPFLVGILQSYTPPAWLAPDDRLHGGDWWNGDSYIDTAQRLEAAGLDFMFFHDTLAVARDTNGSMDAALKWAATAPALDPLYLLPALAKATSRIGLIGTASTTFDHPFRLARAFSTLDSLSGGRIGWNLVTSFEHDAAANFGLTELPGRGDRYDRADEFLQVATALWEAWDPDAIVADLETDTYVDPTKVRSVDFVGEHYRSRGPLNTMRSPQGMPFLAQAGASERGRDFAAQHAELVFSIANGSIEEAKAFRDDIRGRAARFGRNPDDVKVVYGCNVIFLDDDADPDALVPVTPAQFGSQLAWWSTSLSIDLASYPLDEPFPIDTPPPASGIRTMFDIVIESSRQGMTLRETIEAQTKARSNGFKGTPEQVAEQMIAFMAGVGGDGIMISREWEYNAAFLDALTDRVMPVLRDAGAIRGTPADGTTLREHVLGHNRHPSHGPAVHHC